MGRSLTAGARSNSDASLSSQSTSQPGSAESDPLSATVGGASQQDTGGCRRVQCPWRHRGIVREFDITGPEIENYGVYNGQRVLITRGAHKDRTATIIGVNNGWLYRLQDGDRGAIAFFAHNAAELQLRYGIFDNGGLRQNSIPLSVAHRNKLIDMVHNTDQVPPLTVHLDPSRGGPSASAFLFLQDRGVVTACLETLIFGLRRRGLSADLLEELGAVFPEPKPLPPPPPIDPPRQQAEPTPDVVSPASPLPAAAAPPTELLVPAAAPRSRRRSRKQSAAAVAALPAGGAGGKRRGRGRQAPQQQRGLDSPVAVSEGEAPGAEVAAPPDGEGATPGGGDLEPTAEDPPAPPPPPLSVDSPHVEVVLLELLRLFAEEQPRSAPRLRPFCELLMFLATYGAAPHALTCLYHNVFAAMPSKEAAAAAAAAAPADYQPPAETVYTRPYTEGFTPPDHPAVSTAVETTKENVRRLQAAGSLASNSRRRTSASTALASSRQQRERELRESRGSSGGGTTASAGGLAAAVAAAAAAATAAMTDPTTFSPTQYPYDFVNHVNNEIKVLLGEAEAHAALQDRQTRRAVWKQPARHPTPDADDTHGRSDTGGGGEELPPSGTTVARAARVAADAMQSNMGLDSEKASWNKVQKIVACLCVAGVALQPAAYDEGDTPRPGGGGNKSESPKRAAPLAAALAPSSKRVLVASFTVPHEYQLFYAGLDTGAWVSIPYVIRGWWSGLRKLPGGDDGDAPINQLSDITICGVGAGAASLGRYGMRRGPSISGGVAPCFPPVNHNVVLVMEGRDGGSDLNVLGTDRYPQYLTGGFGGGGGTRTPLPSGRKPSLRPGSRRGSAEAPAYRDIGTAATVPPFSCWWVEKVIPATNTFGQDILIVRLREADRPGFNAERAGQVLGDLEFDFANSVKRVRAFDIKAAKSLANPDYPDDFALSETPLLTHFVDMASQIMTVSDAVTMAKGGVSKFVKKRRERQLKQQQEAAGAQYLHTNGLVRMDTTELACRSFGFFAGQRCMYRSEVQSTKRMPTTILGVYGGKLWHHPDWGDIKHFHVTRADHLAEMLEPMAWDRVYGYPDKMHTTPEGLQYNTEDAVTKFGQYHNEVVRCVKGAWEGELAQTLGCDPEDNGVLYRCRLVGGAVVPATIQAQRDKTELVEHAFTLNFAPRFDLLVSPGRDGWVRKFQYDHVGLPRELQCGFDDETPSASGFDVRYSLTRPHSAHHGETVLILIGFDCRCVARVLGVRDDQCWAVLRSGPRTGNIVALAPNTFVRTAAPVLPYVDPYTLLNTHPRCAAAVEAAQQHTATGLADDTSCEYLIYSGEYVELDTSYPVMNVFRLYHGQRVAWCEWDRTPDSATNASSATGADGAMRKATVVGRLPPPP